MSNHTYQTKKYVIYIYINLCSPTLKSYVGVTNDFHRRNKKHKSDSKNPKYYFHKSIYRYGWENFLCFILEETDDVDYAYKLLEPYYIKLCRSFHKDNGYNLTLGGEGPAGLIHDKKKTARKNS